MAMKDEYYSNTDARINTIMDMKAAEFWIQVKRCRQYYDDEINLERRFSDKFYDYLQDQWGIAIEMTDGGLIVGANIADEAKYVFFLLKFS